MSVDLLLTGANGQLGWEIARRSKVSLRALNRADLDVTDAEKVSGAIAAFRPKVVINAGAYTAVDKAETDREAAFAVNRDGPRHLAAACASHGAALIHISTDYVFDGQKKGAYVETDPVAPLGVYGASKLAGENAIRAALPAHVILRTAWVFGVHGHNFVKTMRRLASERPLLKVVDDQRGCPTFAGDLADVVLAVAARLIGRPSTDLLGTFHCVGSGEVSWCGFAQAIVGDKVTVQAITTEEFPTPARRPANSVLDCTKLANTYGLKLRPWQQGLEEMLSRL